MRLPSLRNHVGVQVFVAVRLERTEQIMRVVAASIARIPAPVGRPPPLVGVRPADGDLAAEKRYGAFKVAAVSLQLGHGQRIQWGCLGCPAGVISVIPSGGGRASASMAGVVQIIDEVCGARRRGRQHRDVPGPGGAEPGGRTVLETGIQGLVGEDGGTAVHQDPRGGPGPPEVLGRDARRHAGGPGPISRRIALRIVGEAGPDCSSVALDMANCFRI